MICHDKDFKNYYSRIDGIFLTELQRAKRTFLRTNFDNLYPEIFYTALPSIYVWADKHPGTNFNVYHHKTTVGLGISWESIRASAIFAAEHRFNTNNGILVYELNLRRGGYKELFADWPNEHRMALLSLAVDPYYLTRLIDMGDCKILLTNKVSPEFFNRIPLLFPHLFPDMNVPILLDLVKEYTKGTEDSLLQLGTVIMQQLAEKLYRSNTVLFWEKFFETQHELTEKTLYQAKTTIEKELDQLNQRIVSAVQQLHQASRMYYSWKEEGVQSYKEYIDYVTNIPGIQDVAIEDNGVVTITFAVPCRNYDYDLIKQMLKNENPKSFWHRNRYALSKIFIEEEHILFLGSMLTVDFINFRLHRARNFQEAAYVKGLPSPHFYVFDCWGMNKSPLARALKDQDYIQFFTHLTAAAGNLNFSEAGNMEALFTDAANNKSPYNKPCVAINRGAKLLTWSEYLTYCKEEQANENAAADT